MPTVTSLIDAAAAGDHRAAADLLPLVYDELRKLAAVRMASEPAGHTLNPTALVHEAYLRLVSPADAATWHGRGHFFSAAAEAMRRILVEGARRKKAEKYGGGLRRVELSDMADDPASEKLLALDEALTRLAAEDAIAAQTVILRHFAGLGHEQVAETLKITVYEARQKWTYARAWLRDSLGD